MGLLSTAVELGIRHFDVPRSYGTGDAEAILGDFLSTTHEPCTVTSNVGSLLPSPTACQAGARRRSHALCCAGSRALRGGAVAGDCPCAGGPVRPRSDAAEPRDEPSRPAARSHRGVPPPRVQCRKSGRQGRSKEVLSDLVGSGAIGALVRQRAPPQPGDPPARVLAVPLVQFRDDGDTFGAEVPIGVARRCGTSTITHGVLDRNLKALRSHLAGASESVLREWSSRLDGEVTDASVLAALLLRRAMARNRGGVVLFRTNEPALSARRSKAATTPSRPTNSRRSRSCSLRCLRAAVLSATTSAASGTKAAVVAVLTKSVDQPL